ncbi:hypothetical protein FR932_13300 [Moritella marina ATCC 15381]|uniref:Lipoprotein n=1 Tax=Moritella marina ATCC 15381 TaxID=1202962 RepID=A0A5J6WNL4_MORMI|nr:hypothetical protein [Moritella marina]QFI38758.1 hypothetical protein FR932_13300 [Moritella marina ATCC 15381]
MRIFKILMMSTLLLTACADRAESTRGIHIDIVPTYYTLSLNLNKNKDAQHRLDTFFIEQHERILSGQVEIFVATDTAYNFALQAESKLHGQGIDAMTIAITRVKKPINQRFDYVVQISNHQAIVPICRSAQSGYFFNRDLGCSMDSTRWKSMVRPDAVLNQSDLDSRPSKDS